MGWTTIEAATGSHDNTVVVSIYSIHACASQLSAHKRAQCGQCRRDGGARTLLALQPCVTRQWASAERGASTQRLREDTALKGQNCEWEKRAAQGQSCCANMRQYTRFQAWKQSVERVSLLVFYSCVENHKYQLCSLRRLLAAWWCRHRALGRCTGWMSLEPQVDVKEAPLCDECDEENGGRALKKANVWDRSGAMAPYRNMLGTLSRERMAYHGEGKRRHEGRTLCSNRAPLCRWLSLRRHARERKSAAQRKSTARHVQILKRMNARGNEGQQ